MYGGWKGSVKRLGGERGAVMFTGLVCYYIIRVAEQGACMRY